MQPGKQRKKKRIRLQKQLELQATSTEVARATLLSREAARRAGYQGITSEAAAIRAQINAGLRSGPPPEKLNPEAWEAYKAARKIVKREETEAYVALRRTKSILRAPDFLKSLAAAAAD